MRSQRFEAPGLLDDDYMVVINVFTIIEQEDDEWGNERPPIPKYYLQNTEVDLQPLSGNERAARSGTDYESSHRFFYEPPAEPIPVGAKVEVNRAGIIEHMRVTHVAEYGSHIGVELSA